MKTSYPLLRISKKYNIPYENVLMVAEHCKNIEDKRMTEREVNVHLMLREISMNAMAAIRNVVREMDYMASGVLRMEDCHKIP